MKKQEKLRKLWHLRNEDLGPNGFQKMHVGPAYRFFTSTTATALEEAAAQNMLLNGAEAVTTAKFIRIIEYWFEITASKHEYFGIT